MYHLVQFCPLNTLEPTNKAREYLASLYHQGLAKAGSTYLAIFSFVLKRVETSDFKHSENCLYAKTELVIQGYFFQLFLLVNQKISYCGESFRDKPKTLKNGRKVKIFTLIF